MTYNLKYDDLLNNYEFKIIKRLVKDKYPWVKDIVIGNPDEINRYNTIYVDLIIDPHELGESIGASVEPYVSGKYFKSDYRAPYLSVYFSRSNEEVRDIQRELEKLMTSIHQSPAIPSHLRLPGTRKIQPGFFIYPRPKD